MPDSDAILKEAKKRFEAAWEHDRENRKEASEDLRYLALDQWPADIREQREQAGRPCLVLDHLNQIKNQVVNDIRQARIAIKAVGVDDQTDEYLADIYTSLMRDIQHKCSATHIYSKAAEGAVSCGIGHFRFHTKYADDAVFEQDIIVEEIPYPLAVYWDPASIKPDRSDAKWAFVVEFVPTLAFEDKYPNAKKVDVQVPSDDYSGIYWATKEGVLVAEYWREVPYKKLLVATEDGQTLDATKLPEDFLATLSIVGQREVECPKIEQYTITGSEVLEGPSEWAGKHIPIIPVIGEEICLEKKTVRKGLIRGARDNSTITPARQRQKRLHLHRKPSGWLRQPRSRSARANGKTLTAVRRRISPIRRIKMLHPLHRRLCRPLSLRLLSGRRRCRPLMRMG